MPMHDTSTSSPAEGAPPGGGGVQVGPGGHGQGRRADSLAALVGKAVPHNPFAGRTDLPEVPLPIGPALVVPFRPPVSRWLTQVQRVISALEYNHLPHTFFNIHKNRPLSAILATAREILTEALPIRCVEATFVATLLTNPAAELARFPLSFHSRCGAVVARHIVLAVRYRDKWGALGLSRREDLMFKPLQFNSLAELLREFLQSYERNHHAVRSFTVGLPLSHDPADSLVPFWRLFRVRLRDWSWETVETLLSSFSRMALAVEAEWRQGGGRTPAVSLKRRPRAPARGPSAVTSDRELSSSSGSEDGDGRTPRDCSEASKPTPSPSHSPSPGTPPGGAEAEPPL
eukprot:RCo041399